MMRIVIETDDGTPATRGDAPMSPAVGEDAGPGLAAGAGQESESRDQTDEMNAGGPPEWLVAEIDRLRAESGDDVDRGQIDAGEGPSA